MTVTSLIVRNEYTATAGQTVFNYTFLIFTADDLNVYITPSGQEANDSTDLTTAYTVDVGTIGDPSGGFITLNSGVSSGDLVTIVSNIVEDRTTDYQNSGDFLPDTVNEDFDRTVSIAKQTSDTAGRTLAFEQSEQGVTNLTLPCPSATQFLRWKSDETGMENVDLATSGTPTNANIITYSAGNNFTGGVNRTQENKNIDLISVLDFGSPGNGTDDDSTAWQAALDHADSTGGGTVIVPSGHIWRLSTRAIIPEGCSLVREGYAPIQRDMGTSKVALDGVVYTDGGAVTLKEGASVEGLTFIRNTLTYPVSDTTNFGNTGALIDVLAHDTEVQNCNFFGYTTAIRTDGSNTEKLTISDVKFDCKSGIDIDQSLDVCRITNCHGWPYLTVATGVAANNYRAGTGFKAQNSADQIEFVNCFAFHYENDFAAVALNNATFIGCQADGDGNDATVRTTRGFHVTGNSLRVRLIGCSAFSTGTPYTFASTANEGFQGVTMVGCIAWGGGETGAPAVVLADGDLLMSGCNISDWDYAVWRQGAANTVLVDGCSFQSAGIAVFAQDASTTLGGGWVIGDNTYRNNLAIAAAGSVVPLTPVIVSATSAAVPIFALFMSVTGTTTIDNIDASEVPPYVPFTLVFDSTITITVAGNLNLAGNTSKTFASGDTLTLVRTALDFREVSRSEN